MSWQGLQGDFVDMSAGDVAGTRSLTWTRLLFVLTIIGALVSGYLGLDAFIAGQERDLFGTAFWDVGYYDLQLFVLGSDPLVRPGPYPPLLEFARFAAPAATIYALYEAGRAIFAGQYRIWRNRNRRRHAIVVGQTTAARALSVSLRMRKQTVVAITDGSVEALRAAGVAGAGAVYACADDTDDSTLNVATAQAAATAKRKTLGVGTLRVYAQVSDATLALGLRARWLGLAERDKPDVDFFNVDELAARASLRPGDFAVDAAVAPHVLIAGLGTFGRALLVEYARQWQVRSGRGDERVAVTLVGIDAEQAQRFVARWDVVRDVCDVRTADVDLDTALDVAGDAAPHRAYICYEDEDLALRTALTAARLWRGGEDCVVVRLNRLARHDVFNAPSRLSLLDDVMGRLRLISVTNLACRPETIQEDLVEMLARSIHHQYLLDQLGRGALVGTSVSMRAWEDLPHEVRDTNRAMALDIGGKLAAIGATIAPRLGVATPFGFTSEEVEQLATREHDRWCRERRSAGWRHAETRHDATKRNPSLVSWDQLSEDERAKNRQAVRSMVSVLANVGLQVVRLRSAGPSLADVGRC